MTFDQYTLPNGARIVLVPQKHTQSATTLIMYPVGSRYEPEYLSGVSHYIEHMMFKGTEKRKNAQILTREIDRLGAQYNAFTGKEYTGYYIKANASYLPTTIDILSDMLLHSVFDKDEMEREKGPIIEELKMYRDNPMMNIDNVFEDLLYAGSPLGRDIGGTDEHVRSYKRDDVLSFKDNHYHAGNMVIVIAGNLPDNIQTLISNAFSVDTQTKEVESFSAYGFGPEEKGSRIAIQTKKADQAQLMLGYPAFEHADPKNYTLDVLNTILGGSMSSRLFIKIRERLGLAYVVRSGYETFHDTGYSFVRAGLDPKNINKAIEAILTELDSIFEDGVTDEELADAKTHLEGGLALSLENSSNVSDWFAKEAIYEKHIQTPQAYLDKINAVTVEDIHSVAKEVFVHEKMRIALIGDVQQDDIHYT